MLSFLGTCPMVCQSKMSSAHVPETSASTKQPHAHRTFPLKDVLSEVELALDDYQRDATEDSSENQSQKMNLPKLKTATFNFKTTVDSSTSSQISFFIFTIGGGRSTETTNEVSFEYQVPEAHRQSSTASITSGNSHIQLRNNLAHTISEAAKAVCALNAFHKMPLKQVSITISYGVKWDEKAGAIEPMLVTSGFNFEKSKNAIQSITLSFEN